MECWLKEGPSTRIVWLYEGPAKGAALGFSVSVEEGVIKYTCKNCFKRDFWNLYKQGINYIQEIFYREMSSV